MILIEIRNNGHFIQLNKFPSNYSMEHHRQPKAHLILVYQVDDETVSTAHEPASMHGSKPMKLNQNQSTGITLPLSADEKLVALQIFSKHLSSKNFHAKFSRYGACAAF